MVLEDVDSDNEWQQKQEDQSQAASASLAPPPTHTPNAPCQENNNHAASKPQVSESVTKMSQEDAETQTGRWTPFIESIKREAEDVALATMEERYDRSVISRLMTEKMWLDLVNEKSRFLTLTRSLP